MSHSSRSTNAVCENWFKLVKVDDFLRKSHFRPDVFVVQQYNNILGRQRLFTESYLASANNEKVEKCSVSQTHFPTLPSSFPFSLFVGKAVKESEKESSKSTERRCKRRR